MIKRKDQTGDEDQRYVNREDHDAARRWFERTFKKDRAECFTREQRKANLRRLREEIDKVIPDRRRA